MILVGDCVELMAEMPDASVDAVVTDPPYGLEFMGKEWDRLDTAHAKRDRADELGVESKRPFLAHSVSYQVGRVAQDWHYRWAAEALRVLKPGGHLLAFGGTRTYHRLACAIEDAGFEIRDTIAWMYGSGFPKSLDVSKAIDKAAGAEREVVGQRTDGVGNTPASLHKTDGFAASREQVFAVTTPATPEAQRWQGWGTALKPAHEPIVVARKPLAGTVAGNVLEHGTGALNVDGCRIDGVPPSVPQPEFGSPTGQVYGFQAGEGRNGEMSQASGRWPANVVLDEEAAAMLDEQSGESRSTGGANGGKLGARVYGKFANEIIGANAGGLGDSGGASRFFYVAKASRAERNAGLEGFEERKTFDGGLEGGSIPLKGSPPPMHRNHHPTVKPIALMRWLVRLVTPPGGTVLDPFAGSGTTGIACALEGFEFTGCEQDADYAKIAEARIRWWVQHGADALRIVAERERAEREAEERRDAGQMELAL